MAILYSRLAASLRSLAIILPIHLHLLSLASRFATVSYDYHTYAYEAERRRTCPDTILAFSVNGYVSLTGLREFTRSPTHHITMSTIETTAFQTRYRSLTTASMDHDCYNIQLSLLMAAEKSSETNWRRRRVTGNDDNYHEYWTTLFDSAYERNRIRLTSLISNTIPTSQLSAIISQRTYNQWRDLTPESAIPRTKGEVERRIGSQLSATISRRTYNGRSDLTPECGQFGNQRRSQQTNHESAQLQLHAF